ncbi:hypothetical protein [Tenacibaculum sp. nBUS_03]|uniref:hypothetical protein n=1 Tax=Tenacibaculum sp. nBUS_03 TaxID=3395320 RepID=UPI003EBD6E4D
MSHKRKNRKVTFLKKLTVKETIERGQTELEINSTEKLYDYLVSELPNSVDFKDLYNLCFSLFCTLDILPDQLRSLKINKDVLAKTFSKLSITKNIPGYSNEKNWIEQIDGFLNLKNNFPNHEKSRTLIRRN